jgi:hypothetical protein
MTNPVRVEIVPRTVGTATQAHRVQTAPPLAERERPVRQ